MVQSQIEDKVNPAALWPGVSGDDLALWLFDAELTVERVASAGARAALVAADNPAAITPATRSQLADALSQLAQAIRLPQPQRLQRPRNWPSRWPTNAATTRRGRGAPPRAGHHRRRHGGRRSACPGAARRAADRGPVAAAPADDGPSQRGLQPTTRQAIQVAVAASLAIVTGELVSPARWYWAVIAAFVIFAGTNSWGETLTKGWQRLLGTGLGVPCGC
ncbi:fusaric acid resistance -like family protein [Mycobacterium xenopi 4042]|uniref:Fusaric acid resistance-like family protein n=1 Tax=Mycobacterium xenopi 4042 TaxID=1299334 RepID=X8CA76_MYCXE|nr:fusaric acid resistance -like family protein [Mycobacterium xenopi 4042]